MDRPRETGIDEGREWARGPNKGGMLEEAETFLCGNFGLYGHLGKPRALGNFSWKEAHSHAHVE